MTTLDLPLTDWAQGAWRIADGRYRASCASHWPSSWGELPKIAYPVQFAPAMVHPPGACR